MNENNRLPKEGFMIKDKFYSPEYMEEKLWKIERMISMIEVDIRLDQGKEYLRRDYLPDLGLKN